MTRFILGSARPSREQWEYLDPTRPAGECSPKVRTYKDAIDYLNKHPDKLHEEVPEGRNSSYSTISLIHDATDYDRKSHATSEGNRHLLLLQGGRHYSG